MEFSHKEISKILSNAPLRTRLNKIQSKNTTTTHNTGNYTLFMSLQVSNMDTLSEYQRPLWIPYSAMLSTKNPGLNITLFYVSV